MFPVSLLDCCAHVLPSNLELDAFFANKRENALVFPLIHQMDIIPLNGLILSKIEDQCLFPPGICFQDTSNRLGIWMPWREPSVEIAKRVQSIICNSSSEVFALLP